MSLVLDASATLAWFFVDERTPAAEQLLDRVIAHGAEVPGIWRIKVGNALLVAERRSRMKASDRQEATRRLMQLPVVVDPETGSHAWGSIFELALRFKLTLYSACYLELALRRGLPLATLDSDLRAAAVELGLDMAAG